MDTLVHLVVALRRHRRPPRVASRSRRTAAAALAALVWVTGATSASWADATSDRNATRQKQHDVQSQIDLARATDDAVEAEAARLDGAVAAQQAIADAAHQSELAALAGVQEATARLDALDARVRGLRQDLARRAVQAYTDPASGGGFMTLAKSASLDEAASRQTLLDLVQSSTTGVVEGLRGTRQDQAEAAKALRSAHQVASQRASAEAAKTRTLQASRAAQQATHAELTKRISDLQAESSELASHEQDLETLIRQRSAAVAAAAAAAGGGGGSGGGPVAPGTQVGSGNPSSYGLIWPIHAVVTSEFGPRWGGFHPGIDIAGSYGTPIAAAKAGTVVFAGPNDGYGNFVVIDHGGGLSTAYAHQSSIAVSEGQRVSQGQVIGFEGSTGFSTGPHVHFEVRIDGVAQNPRLYEVGSP
ncbi:MAG: murein hydrolase activator EnvC [Acidimicrobiales bacterium]